MNLSQMAEAVGVQRFGRSGYSCVVDKQGHALAHPDMKNATTLTDLTYLNPVAGVIRD